ncbi:ArnT family glycosyltransferase [Singulisphaera sp. PoT]|uniref:ArnT family glycosyltransferase n=1 Tax=Singulisphaera sp. PoT TaxID=3411797 RepID=UPI003BF4CA29
MTERPLAAKKPFWSLGKLTLAWTLLALLATVGTIGGIGITVDEPLDVRPGRTYIATLFARGSGFFRPEVVDMVFRDNAEHPPLGRWLLGIASTLGEPIEMFLMGGPDPLRLYIHAARVAPAVCFALLVGLIVWTAGSHYGRAAASGSGFAMLAMPRLFAHAHLGALDTFLCLFWILGLLTTEFALRQSRNWLFMFLAGLAWGLALLTKIHAWFLAPILFLWWVLTARNRSGKVLLGWVAWGVGGFGVYLLGWPWLWHHSLERLRAYAGTGVERTSIQVLYFGQVFADRDVPWHYPWFYFLVTVPVGLHLLGGIGVFAGRRDRFSWLLWGAILFFLILFSTRIPVYDGERLFLVVFPLWAVVIGLGFSKGWEWAGPHRVRRGLLSIFLVAQGFGLVSTHPFGLSYYNLLVGGLPGAERLGLELTYWNDAVDSTLLDRLAKEARPGDTAALAPTLYPTQGMASTTRLMARDGLVLGDEDKALKARWVVVSRRTAYWKPALKKRLEAGKPILLRSRQGVWLSGLWDFGGSPRSSADSPSLSETRASP